jgi:hypothetical protein
VVDTSSAAALRSREISRLCGEYAQLSHQLPGRAISDHRQLMRNTLDKLDQILSLLANPRSDLVLQQHLLALEDARDRLSDNAATDVAVEPAIDTGLRSAYNALQRIAHDKDFETRDIAGPMADFKSRLDELDTVHGLTHQVVVAEAVDASTAVVNKMADVIASQIAPASEATTAPATAPATQPAADVTAPPATAAPGITAPPPSEPSTTVPPTTAPATQPQ